MNLHLRPVYYCHTSKGNWGKGMTIKEAKKAAQLHRLKDEKSCTYVVTVACFNSPTDEELMELYKCITADPVWGAPQFYTHLRTSEDTELIEKYFVGWVTIDYKPKV